MILIIDIPDDNYKFIKDLQSLIIGGRGNCKTIQYNVINAIKNGTPYEERPKDEWKCFIGSAYYGVDEDNEPIWKERKIYHCPFCNRRTVIKENFCPNCGADMRGDL